MDPVIVVGAAQISSAAEAIQYPPDAAVELMDAITGLPDNGIRWRVHQVLKPIENLWYIAVHEIRVKCIEVGDTSGFRTAQEFVIDIYY